MATASAELKRRVGTRLALAPIVLGLVFFPAAGTFRFWQAWVYTAVLVLPMIGFLAYFMRRDPELIDRRLRTREKERPQKVIIALSYPAFLAAFLLPGFDRRFGWSSVPPALSVAADLVVLVGYGLFVLVVRENRYASRVIEVEAGQRVITSGPYAVVRHPMYAANCLIYLASPLALGSYWAVIPAVVTPLLMIPRILNEEKVLAEKLPGYSEYLGKVRSRLIPGVW